MNKAPLSVLVIAQNEERNIAACLESVAWADDIVVVDGASADATASLARAFTPHVFAHPWQGFSEAKQFGLQHCAYEWVLWLDADERVTDGLAREIRNAIAAGSDAVAAFEIPRRAFFLGTWIRHCGWYPGFVARLFRKSRCRFSTSSVHEQLLVDGATKRLTHDLLHYTDEDLDHYFNKFNVYTSLAAADIAKRRKGAGLFDLLARPPFTFVRMYVFRAGFLDGWHGLLLCALSAFYVFVKYAKTRELQRASRRAVKGAPDAA